jgi:hypothetical protein
MKKISIEPSTKTPTVIMDPEQGLVEIKGRSIPENSVEFYKPVMEWLDEYSNNSTATSTTNVNIQLEYFNTSSSKCILDIFKKLELIHKKSNNIVINWFYEEDDEDMQEAGEDYQAIIKVPFKMQMIVP